jgi:osmotically-inducible protein OsmY
MQSSLQALPSQNGPSDQVEIASISEPRDSDGELVTRARSILRWKIRYNAVHVAARDGHIILSGHVFSNLDREAAEHTIRKMTGVVTVTNRIVITSPLISRQRRGMTRPAPRADG